MQVAAVQSQFVNIYEIIYVELKQAFNLWQQRIKIPLEVSQKIF